MNRIPALSFPPGGHWFLLMQGSEGDKCSFPEFQRQQEPVRAEEGGTANQLQPQLQSSPIASSQDRRRAGLFIHWLKKAGVLRYLPA